MDEVPALELRNLRKQFGAVIATDGVSLTFPKGELHAIIGPNGAGKTTLISQIAGELQPTSGQIFLNGADVTTRRSFERSHAGLARSFQITCLCPEFTTLENVALAVQARRGHSYLFWAPATSDASIQTASMELLERVGLGPRAGMRAGTLAHGEQRQLELGMALASDPKVLLLDEPMAGMGKEDSARMVALLRALKGSLTMLLVEHDMDAVFALADRVSVLVYGRCIATGAPAQIKGDRAVRDAYLGEESG